ncbi:MAG: hypothetical protein GY811_24365 [Myxococcales bacterium]|nr:hypothetical protein [Myxococcales bacterium]
MYRIAAILHISLDDAVYELGVEIGGFALSPEHMPGLPVLLNLVMTKLSYRVEIRRARDGQTAEAEELVHKCQLCLRVLPQLRGWETIPLGRKALLFSAAIVLTICMVLYNVANRRVAKYGTGGTDQDTGLGDAETVAEQKLSKDGGQARPAVQGFALHRSYDLGRQLGQHDR